MDDAERIDAINAALDAPLVRTYGDQEPMHYGTQVRWRDGGPNPLDAVSIYWNEVGPHWHYVTWGLTELDDKVSDVADVSGWGIELTFRLAATPADREAAPPIASHAPRWPIAMLDLLAKLVWERSTVYGPGQSIGFGAPPDPERRLAAAGFVGDPQLGNVQTINGRVRYLQVFGLRSRDEMDRLRDPVGHEPAMRALAGDDGLYVTRLDRAPL